MICSPLEFVILLHFRRTALKITWLQLSKCPWAAQPQQRTGRERVNGLICNVGDVLANHPVDTK